MTQQTKPKGMSQEQIESMMQIAAANGDWHHYHKLKGKLL